MMISRRILTFLGCVLVASAFTARGAALTFSESGGGSASGQGSLSGALSPSDFGSLTGSSTEQAISGSSGLSSSAANSGALNFGMFDPVTLTFDDPGLTQYTTMSDNQYLFGTSASGNAAPIAVAPEPSSLILLGTGILGIAGMMRRRIFATRI